MRPRKATVFVVEGSRVLERKLDVICIFIPNFPGTSSLCRGPRFANSDLNRSRGF